MVAQTSALLVLEPIFEADLQPEQYAYRPGRSANDAVKRLNWMISGWANYYHHGQVGPAYSAINNHSTRRLRQWLCRKHKVKSGKYVRYPNPRLWKHYGLTCLEPKTQGLPWAKA